MNSMERFERRLAHEEVDRAPNFSIVMFFAARYVGKNMADFCSDYRTMVEGNIRCCRDFGIDILNTMSDPFRETADYGAEITYYPEKIPHCDPIVKDRSDLDKLRRFDPRMEGGRIADRIKAVELYKKECGNEIPIMGWVEGPLAETADLHGVTQTMMDTILEPEFIDDLMDICVEQAIRCGIEQIKSGAHIIGVGDAVASLVSPEYYRDHVLPREQKLFGEFRKRGAYTRLHICGDINRLLPYIHQSGADIIDIDWMVDLKKVTEIFPSNVFPCGNFDPVSVLMKGTIDEIKGAVKNCLDMSDERLIVMPGCEVPVDTPHDNLKAVTEALYEYAKR